MRGLLTTTSSAQISSLQQEKNVQTTNNFSTLATGYNYPSQGPQENNSSLSVVAGQAGNGCTSASSHAPRLESVAPYKAQQSELGLCSTDAEEDGHVDSPRILPAVAAFSIQCSLCLKWRLIPSKELYEEIRQHILENPFSCSRAASWRPNACCDDPSDLSQDASHVWAIDQPNIPVAPSGWERLIVLRAEGSTKFADVYYKSPTGRRLRSMPEVERYLVEHPEYVDAGVSLSQFSFVKPKPLDQGYVRKRNVYTMGRMRGSIPQKKPYDKD